MRCGQHRPMEFLKTLGLFTATDVAEIVGCHLAC